MNIVIYIGILMCKILKIEMINDTSQNYEWKLSIEEFRITLKVMILLQISKQRWHLFPYSPIDCTFEPVLIVCMFRKIIVQNYLTRIPESLPRLHNGIIGETFQFNSS